MSNFQELLAELQGTVEQQGELAKSLPAGTQGQDDATIKAAAAEAGVKPPAVAEAGAAAAGAADDENEDDEDDEALGKSFQFVDAHGQTQQAVDATDLVKSLMARADAAEKRVEDTENMLTKALPQITGLIKSQGEMIKSLGSQIATLSSQGRGRKTLLNVSDKPDLGDLKKSQGEQSEMTPSDFFAKANTAFDQGKITGMELNTISVCMRMNELGSLDSQVVNKVLKA